jgi:hypothetical protein
LCEQRKTLDWFELRIRRYGNIKSKLQQQQIGLALFSFFFSSWKVIRLPVACLPGRLQVWLVSSDLIVIFSDNVAR